jgi:hypothetical protein
MSLGWASGLLSVVWFVRVVVLVPGVFWGLVVRLGADLRDRVGVGRLDKLLRSDNAAVWLCLVPVAPVV